MRNHVVILGTGATELIHVSRAVMAFGGMADFFVPKMFNFPTFAEAYKVAVPNGVNTLALV
jgi:NAD(P) transhydrogenase